MTASALGTSALFLASKLFRNSTFRRLLAQCCIDVLKPDSSFRSRYECYIFHISLFVHGVRIFGRRLFDEFALYICILKRLYRGLQRTLMCALFSKNLRC
jgi:hypothetical protein